MAKEKISKKQLRAEKKAAKRALMPKKEVDVNKLRVSKKVFSPGPGRSRAGNIINFLFLCAVGTFMVLPLIYIVNNAFKPLDELFVFPPRFFVRHPTLDNFQDIGVLMGESWVPFSRYIANTVFITVVTTVGQIICASLAAYVLEKRKFPGRDFMFRIIVLSLMFTPAVTGIPSYIIMANLGLVDTYWALILPGIGGSMGLYLMKQFMSSSIPDALLESARIDGATELRIFRSIVMPLVKPAWLTMILLAVQGMWGITGGNVIFTEAKKPLNYALNQILAGGISRAGAGAAVSLIMLLPPLTVFIITQTRVLDTMASSGIKE